MDQAAVLDKVRKLIARAEHTATPIHEADSARAMADGLMLRFAIDDITVRAATPAGARPAPAMREVPIGGHTAHGTLLGSIAGLAADVAAHCRCRIRHYARWDPQEHQYYARVYGYAPDIAYFDILYTTLRLHMLGALLPRIEEQETLEENCYRLHNAGYNWLEIAELYGWYKYHPYAVHPQNSEHMAIKAPYKHNETEEVRPATQVGSHYKRAYLRAAAARNETPTQIPAGGSQTYRASAAQGYESRIYQRLSKMRSGRQAQTQASAALALRTSAEDLEAFFRKENPDLFPFPATEPAQQTPTRKGRPRKLKPSPFSAAGYERGAQHAESAPLRPEAAPHAPRPLS